MNSDTIKINYTEVLFHEIKKLKIFVAFIRKVTIYCFLNIHI